jgi:uncharacterized membrane protein
VSVFIPKPHPRTTDPKGRKPPAVADEHVGLNGRIAAFVTRTVGTMWVVYFTALFVLAWVTLGTLWGPLHKADPYPFAFLLFLGNVVQLMLVFVILVGQSVLGAAADKRALQTYLDAEAILHEVQQLHEHLLEQDKVLNQGHILVDPTSIPWIEERKSIKPARVADQHVGLNGRIAAFLTRAVGTMWAFYVAAIFQFGWMALALIGIFTFDPYPFAFLLFISSLLQLIFMFVIMVGQDVLGKAGDKRAQQTFLDAEAVLQQCQQLQHHLQLQDEVIVELCGYIQEHAAAGHPIRDVKAPKPAPTIS